MATFIEVVRSLAPVNVRFIVIGVGAANYYSPRGQTLFATQDQDLFLPPEPSNLLATWQVCRSLGLELSSNHEPLGEPLDLRLAERVVEHRATVRAADQEGLQLDLTLTMTGFDFDEVWKAHRVFTAEGVEIPVARLAHVVASKRQTARPKDHLFLETHEQLLRELLEREETS